MDVDSFIRIQGPLSRKTYKYLCFFIKLKVAKHNNNIKLGSLGERSEKKFVGFFSLQNEL